MKLTTPTLFLSTSLALASPQEGALGPNLGDSSGPAGQAALTAIAREDLAALWREVLFDETDDGRVWARGPDWKASFGPDGFVYIPFFGSDAPESYPVAFELDRVTLGGEDIAFECDPTAALEGDVITLARGDFEEVFHARTEGVEQTFVFESLPATNDLRIHLDVASELAASPSDGGWVFENERGHVRYGAATAVDADGRAFALDQRWVDGGIEIEVPTATLAAARFPLVVDPVVSTFSVEDDNREQIDVDVAYDAANDVYMMVWEEEQDATDHDIISAYYNVSLGLVVDPAAIDISDDNWALPSVANAHFDETFLCVAQTGTFSLAYRVYGRTRDAATGARGPKFLISSNVNEQSSPDVGGSGADVNTAFDFVVVYQTRGISTDYDIIARPVTSTSVVGSTTYISGVANEDYDPRISKSSGRPNLPLDEHQYMIVWEREVTATDHNLWARVIDYDVDTTGHSRFQAYSFGDSIDPDVSMQSTNLFLATEPFYVIVFERRQNQQYNIRAIVARDGSADNAKDLTVMQDIDVADEQSDPGIAFDSQDYIVVYKSEATGGGDDVFMTVLEVVDDGNELRTGLTERRTALRTPDGTATAVAIASNWAGGHPTTGSGETSVALALWTGVVNGPDTEVDGAIVREITAAINGSQYCDANENSTGRSAWIKASGSSSHLGFMDLDCIDMPPGEFGYFLVSNTDGFTANPGGSAGNLCLGGNIGRYSAQVASTGAAGALTLPVDPTSFPHGFAAAPGETWYFQSWFRDGQTSNFSNAVSVAFQ